MVNRSPRRRRSADADSSGAGRTPSRTLALAMLAAIGVATWSVSSALDGEPTSPKPVEIASSPPLPGVHERDADHLDGRILDIPAAAPC